MDGKSIIMLMLCVNVMLYLFGFVLVSDPITAFLDKDKLGTQTPGQLTNTTGGIVSINTDVQNQFPQEIKQGTIVGDILNVFSDGLAIMWGFAKILFNLLTSPVALFTTGLHPTFAIMLGIPFSIGYILAIVVFIRGASL